MLPTQEQETTQKVFLCDLSSFHTHEHWQVLTVTINCIHCNTVSKKSPIVWIPPKDDATESNLLDFWIVVYHMPIFPMGWIPCALTHYGLYIIPFKDIAYQKMIKYVIVMWMMASYWPMILFERMMVIMKEVGMDKRTLLSVSNFHEHFFVISH